jgi:hypothetical protein
MVKELKIASLVLRSHLVPLNRRGTFCGEFLCRYQEAPWEIINYEITFTTT